jgi:hypothetical protein
VPKYGPTVKPKPFENNRFSTLLERSRRAAKPALLAARRDPSRGEKQPNTPAKLPYPRQGIRISEFVNVFQ